MKHIHWLSPPEDCDDLAVNAPFMHALNQGMEPAEIFDIPGVSGYAKSVHGAI